MPKEIQNNSGSLSSKHRLAQIIAILKKHHLTKGIDPVKLRMILEDLGPTFVKIGQIMSSRQDMFSERWIWNMGGLKAIEERNKVNYEIMLHL